MYLSLFFLLYFLRRQQWPHTYRLAAIARESWSSVSFLPNDVVPLPFPSLSAATSISHLRSFAAISKGLFKLVFVGSDHLGSDLRKREPSFDGARNWECCSFSLFSRVTGDRIGTMDSFPRALAGMGWTLFKTAKNPSPGGRNHIHLFRNVDSRRVRVVRIDGDGGECRVRELLCKISVHSNCHWLDQFEPVAIE